MYFKPNNFQKIRFLFFVLCAIKRNRKRTPKYFLQMLKYTVNGPSLQVNYLGFP